MEREFVVADIHGCYKTFRYLVEEILQPSRSDRIYLLGDYINKGPSSKFTLDYIMDLQDQGFRVFPLMGNHEKSLLDALTDPAQFYGFIEKGGAFTLKDFKVDKISDIPQKYISFMKSLEYYVERDQWFLVHAGFNFRSKKPFHDAHSMLNIREMVHDPVALKGKKVVHGHVPVPLKNILQQNKQLDLWNFYLDGGCVYPYREGMGFLAALELTENRLYIKECIDAVEV